MYMLAATYLLVKTILQTFFQTNFRRINSLVIDGRLDLVLTKPVSSQFFVSLRRISILGIVRLLFTLGILYLVIQRTGVTVPLVGILFYFIYIILGIIIFYSIWFMSVLSVFWLGRINNIAFISRPMLNIAKFPLDVYPRGASLFLTFVIPLAFIATIPTKSILGYFSLPWLFFGLFAAAFFLYLSHLLWNAALKRYSSAGG